jgi:hypothetical protein
MAQVLRAMNGYPTGQSRSGRGGPAMPTRSIVDNRGGRAARDRVIEWPRGSAQRKGRQRIGVEYRQEEKGKEDEDSMFKTDGLCTGGSHGGRVHSLLRGLRRFTTNWVIAVGEEIAIHNLRH